MGCAEKSAHSVHYRSVCSLHLERSWSASTMLPTVHVHAVETCENVREVLTLVFFAANTRDETSSLALEQSGVITKET